MLVVGGVGFCAPYGGGDGGGICVYLNPAFVGSPRDTKKERGNLEFTTVSKSMPKITP